MQINVVDLWSEPEAREVEGIQASIPQRQQLPNTILYIPIPRWTRVSQVGDLLHERPSSPRRLADFINVADVVVLRAHPPEAQGLLQNRDIARDLRERLEGRPVWVLSWADNRHVLKSLVSSKDFSIPRQQRDLLKVLRSAELEMLANQPGALLPQVSDFHYEAPNGKHYSSFLRVGLALQSYNALDAVSFWLLPYLRDNPLILLDSWTILSLGLNARRYIAEYGFGSATHLGLVECLRSYNEDIDDLLDRLTHVNEHYRTSPRILFILGVSSSGSLAERVISACKSSVFSRVKTIALYTPHGVEPKYAEEALCELSSHFPKFDHYERLDCQLCADGIPRVRIQPETYLLELSAAVEEPGIGEEMARAGKSFFEAYRGSGHVSLHRNRYDNLRHHMIYIDVIALLNTNMFKRKLEATLAHFNGRVDVILAPTHPAAKTFAEHVRQVLDMPHENVIQCDEARLSSDLTSAQQNILKAAKTMLLVDDVVITGSRLRGFRHFLHRGGFLPASKELHFLVGVARPRSKMKMRAIRYMAHDTRETRFFWPVEEILLPDWGEQECPWCWELRQLKLMDQTNSEITSSSFMEKRYYLLQNVRDGIQTYPFLHWADPADQLALSNGSHYGDDLSAVELFASVASALQYMRSGDDPTEGGYGRLPKLNEQYTSPVTRVLSPEKTIESGYHDYIITASIIRAARRHDLSAASTEKRLMSATSTLLVNAVGALELRSEVLLAMSQGKLPIVPEVSTLARDFPPEPGVWAFLESLLRRNS